MILTRAAAVALAVLAGTTILAQTPDRKLEFEVASVRPSSKSVGDTAPVALGLRLDGSQARIGALTLRDYIAMAYRIKSYQVMGADWVSTDRFRRECQAARRLLGRSDPRDASVAAFGAIRSEVPSR